VLLDKIDSPNDIKQFNSDQLLELCKELSKFYIDTISGIGGHLGAGLGVIELTVALHYVFDSPKDKLIWDVSHQAHIHKILTGRRDKIMTLKKENGLSGFTKRCESIHDAFGAGHSSTSISAALGMDIANSINSTNHHIIPIIGDGALGAGMAYEAINHAGSQKNNLIVILNDNQMSISPTVGAMSKYLKKITTQDGSYQRFKNIVKSSLHNSPVKDMIGTTVKTIEKNFKHQNIFEDLGFDYIGPIDGHDVNSLVELFKHLKNRKEYKPILIHALTKKGNGFYSNKCENESYHAVAPFCTKTGAQTKQENSVTTYTKAFANRLIEEAQKDSKIVAITAAMESGTGLSEFKAAFPKRFFDVGIAEQHAVTFAAGLACENIKPFVSIYSTFIQRAYDQIVHDVAIQKLPVRFALDRSGLVGGDGATHAGSFDLTFLGALPNFVIMAPSDENELSKMVTTSVSYEDGPIALRYPRGNGTGVRIESPQILKIGKGRIVQEGNDIAIFAVGTRLQEALKASALLESAYNIKPTIIDPRFIKPIDTELVERVLNNHKVIITAEENSIGGFSAQFNELVLKKDLHKNKIIKNLYLPDIFLDHGKPYDLYERAGLNSSAIVSEALQTLNRSNVTHLNREYM
jgi:1-deoxy-D-xylulose-5-phosphate synthase